MIYSKKYTDISDSIGAPFGGFGTGYVVYGRYGFTNWNVDGYPDKQQTSEYPKTKLYNYYNENPDESPVVLFIEKGGNRKLLQTRKSAFAPGEPCTDFKMYVLMPYGKVKMSAQENTDVSMLLYSSVKPHDINRTSIPSCVFEITIANKSGEDAEYILGIDYDKNIFTAVEDNELTVLRQKSGEVSFGFKGGKNGKIIVKVPADSEKTVIGDFSWYYPIFETPRVSRNDIIIRQQTVSYEEYDKAPVPYKRNYVNRYANASEVARDALASYQMWKLDIDKWHDSLDVPDDCSRIWFGSYASVITATMYSSEGYVFEAEQPHGFVNTMDVSVYSTWIYMINWPEVERKDLEMFISAIPMKGIAAGKVWHSLWEDGAHYVEEAIYAVRIWRYGLWSGDKQFLRSAFPSVKAALTFMYESEGIGSLIENRKGTQSYDAWKMPGIGVYVNSQWIYALFSLKRICEIIGEEPVLCNRNLYEFIDTAVKEFNEQLWDAEGGYWHAYKPTENSLQLPYGNAVFGDQLFGHWAVMLDPESEKILDGIKEKSALRKIYTHNRIFTPDKTYSCWANGMLPEKEKTVRIQSDYDGDEFICGYHALTCWICTQVELASMLGYFGMDDASREVFSEVSKGIGKNVLAAGEYNRSLDANLQATDTDIEIGKDTPRFPPYPRYKSSWEYLACLLGLKMTMDEMIFSPLHNTDFNINGVILAGVRLNISVQSGWTECFVNGVKTDPVVSRTANEITLEFR